MDKSRNLSCQGKPGKELKKRTKESRQTPERGPRRLGRRIRGQRGMFRTHLVRPLLPFPGAASCRSRSGSPRWCWSTVFSCPAAACRAGQWVPLPSGATPSSGHSQRQGGGCWAWPQSQQTQGQTIVM
ncbi:uncharacterized protein ACWYII_045172 isoform 1-T1 [Salvelinus alpinus]